MRASVEERIARLEARNRRLGRLAAVALLGAAWPLLVAVEKPHATKIVEAQVVQAQKLVLSDAKGIVRMEIGLESDGSAAIKFLDGSGGAVMSLRGTNATPIIELADGAGGSVWLSASSTGASLSLSKGKGEIELATRATGEPSIKLQDRDGKVVWHAP